MKNKNFKKNDELNEKITTLKKRSIYENYVDDIFSKLINTEKTDTPLSPNHTPTPLKVILLMKYRSVRTNDDTNTEKKILTLKIVLLLKN
jgi:hypothetical protein